MPFSLLPTMILPAVTDITPELLKNRGIELLMMDFDNTIVPYTTDIPTPEVENWIKTMLASDIRLCVVSNSHNDRVPRFCQAYGLDCITHAKKPGTVGIRKCMERYGVRAQVCALVGDQIYTDTLGGNMAGIRTILVQAIDNHNFLLKARHVLEMPFIWAAESRRELK